MLRYNNSKFLYNRLKIGTWRVPAKGLKTRVSNAVGALNLPAMGEAGVADIVCAFQQQNYRAALYVRPRATNLIHFCCEGQREYAVDGRTLFVAEPGDILFMPVASHYCTTPVSPGGARGLGIDFRLRDKTGAAVLIAGGVVRAGHDESGAFFSDMLQLKDLFFKGGVSSFKAKSIMFGLLYDLFTGKYYSPGQAAPKSIYSALRYIEGHINERLNVDGLAHMCLMSRSTFFRRFHEEIGMTPADYILRQRVQKGRKMLMSGLYSVEETAQMLGFCDGSHFSHAYKRITGGNAGDCRPGRSKLPERGGA